ncbi:MAG: hypothetical protein AAFN42_12670 [Cyanobacteria bacterium J06554_1]
MEEQIQHLREMFGIESLPNKPDQLEFPAVSSMAVSTGEIFLLAQDDLLNDFSDVSLGVIMTKSPKADKEATSEDAPLLPPEPDTEKGRRAREQYLALAKASLRVNFEDYQTLFQAYASEEPEEQQTAQQLDRTVAQVALQAGQCPRQVVQFVARDPMCSSLGRAASVSHCGINSLHESMLSIVGIPMLADQLDMTIRGKDAGV